MLFVQAYNVPPDSILNAPDWASTERFDIEAKILGPDPASVPLDHEQMWRNLLADRFGAVIRETSVDSDGYALVLAEEGGSLGPNLRPSAGGCVERSALDANADPTDRGTGPTCGIRSQSVGLLNGQGVPLSQLTRFLGGGSGLLIVDQTGLDGTYDFELSWAPEDLNATPAEDPVLRERPDLFTAVREQFGLRLEPGVSIPGGAIYVEKIERPTPN
jgi:uncharacterized protein (TIGR03435 family)